MIQSTAPRANPTRKRVKAKRQPVSFTLIITAGYFLLLAMLGGGVVEWSPAYMTLSAATLIAAFTIAWVDGGRALCDVPLLGRLALAGIVLLPLLQLVPLPPALWHAAPGQEVRIQTLGLVGLADTWQVLSLSPFDTATAALMAAGFVVSMAAVMRLDDAGFVRLLNIAVGVVAVGMLLGVLQVLSDGQFPRFHAVNTGATLLGFYANKNHMGLIIACMIVLFGLVVGRRYLVARARGPVIGIISLFAFICIIPTNSRAGLAFGAIALLVVFADLTKRVPSRYRIAALVGTGLLAVLLMSSTNVQLAMQRFNDVDDDLRWRILEWSKPLAERYYLLGAGGGTFVPIFNANEHLSWVKPTYVNAAHNDYMQLVIEFGIPGLVVLALLALSVLQCIRPMLSLPRHSPHRWEMRFGMIVIAMFAIHSLIDYPLRRPAGWAFFVLALAALYRGRASQDNVSLK